MAVEQRHLSFLDDYDDFPYDPLLRIPPLQDPIPSSASRRPSPLEPNARVNAGIHNATAKLTSRREALRDAKPIGESDCRTGGDRRINYQGAKSGVEGLRKRQKLHDHERITDFVQLPKPKSKVQEEKPPPFQPVSVLNELHEPPPSAALFPPITPSASQDGEDQSRYGKSSYDDSNTKPVPSKGEDDSRGGKGPSGKRLNLRPRQKWTDRETRQLLKGIELYGLGKWKKILHHREYSFHPERTAVDLKDRYRTCLASRKVIESLNSTSPTDNEPPSKHETLDSTDHAVKPLKFSPPKSRPPKPRKPPDATSSALALRRKPKTPWTDEEDADLAKGYRQHGFQWTAIAKDPKLRLARRTGPQVRDRFRILHPEIYRQSGSVPSLDEFSMRLDASAGELETSELSRKESKPPSPVVGRGTPDAEPQEINISQGHDDELNQHSAAAAEEVSHSAPPPPALGGILGLLNDEAEEVSRLPSFKYPYDDDWGGDSVTLPPLLWEDMATRPMFDLE